MRISDWSSDVCSSDLTELNGHIAVTFFIAHGDDLAAFEAQDSDGHVAAVVLKQAGHPHFLRDHASPHDHTPQQRPGGPFRTACGKPSSKRPTATLPDRQSTRLNSSH